MSDSDNRERFSLSRWSRRKLEAARAQKPSATETPNEPPKLEVQAEPKATVAVAADAPPVGAAPELPPIESLSFDSDFSAFMQPKVDEGTKRAALKKLFSDPRFNVMDGLDVYIDDYTKSDPIPEATLAALAHTRYLFDPPKTRVNAQGFVEDMPDEEAAEATGAQPQESSALSGTGAATGAGSQTGAEASLQPAGCTASEEFPLQQPIEAGVEEPPLDGSKPAR